MAINDIYVLTLWGGVLGAETRQDFGYKVTTELTTPSAALMRAAFITGVLNPLSDIVSEDMPFNKTITKNLFNANDWEEHNITPTIFGNRTGQAYVLFAAAAFKSSKPTSFQAPCRKRFGYLSETDVQGGGLQNVTGYFAALDSLANELGNVLIDADDNEYTPVIIRRIPYTTSNNRLAYRYPHNNAEAVTYPAVGWSWSNIVTSQVSRKVGRGI